MVKNCGGFVSWINKSLGKAIHHIKENVNLLEYLTSIEQVSFTKFGSNYRAQCPLHNDKDPSFTVTKNKNIYYCFGCKSGGTIINFIEQKYNFNRVEAIHHIFNEMGWDINQYKDDNGQSSSINESAMQYFLSQNKSQTFVDFFKTKKFDASEEVGYCGNEHDLKTYLLSNGFSDKEIWSYGLYGEQFNNAIVFPVRGVDGFINHFNCRLFGDVKYFKTQEDSPVFEENILYGCHKVKSQVPLVVVEGCNDYYALRDKHNVVSMMGTKFNQEMVDFVKLYDIDEVIFWVDGDAGGWDFLKSMYKKYADLFCKNKISAYCVFVSKKDPDDIPDYDVMGNKVLIPIFILDSMEFESDHGLVHFSAKNCVGYNTITIKMMVDYLVGKTKWSEHEIKDVFYEFFDNKKLYDVLTEKQVLSVCCTTPASVVEFGINADYFGVYSCRQIFNSINGGVFNRSSLDSKLSDYFGSLPAPTVSNMQELVDILRSLSEKRKLYDVIKNVMGTGVNTDEAIQSLNDALISLYKGTKDVLVNGVDSFKNVVSNIISGHSVKGIPFGENWKKLDSILFGLCDHRLVMLSGSTGHGKTTMALNWVYSMSILGNSKGLYFSGEMPHEEITQRLVSMGTGIPYTNIQTGRCNDEDMKKIYNMTVDNNFRNLFVNDTMLFDKLIRTIKYSKIRHDIDYVVIDYLQLIEPSRNMVNINRPQQLKEMTRILKTQICEELNLPVLIIAQLSDQALDDPMPLARRTSESKLVQSDCDVTMGMRKKTDKERELDPLGNILLYVDKVRYNGGSLLVPVNWMADICYMREV